MQMSGLTSVRSFRRLAIVGGCLVIASPGLAGTVAAAKPAVSAKALPATFSTSSVTAIPKDHGQVEVLGYDKTRTVVARFAKGKYSNIIATPKSAQVQTMAAASKSSIWIGGYSGSGSGTSPVILKLVGRHWKAQKLPALGTGDSVSSIAATSGSNVWAVGYLQSSDGSQAEALHFNGSTWSAVPIESEQADVTFEHAATSSNKNAWAVLGGDAYHWNGAAWTSVTIPSVVSVAGFAAAGSHAWVVGSTAVGKAASAYFNGKTFAGVKTAGSKQSALASVTMSGSSAWAVGYQISVSHKTEVEHALLMHATSKSWKVIKAPSTKGSQSLQLVAATSAKAAVTFGAYSAGRCGTKSFVSESLAWTLSTSAVTSQEHSENAAAAEGIARIPAC